MFAPLFGVVLVDHFIQRRRRSQMATVGFRGMTLLAWLGGVSTYHLLANMYPDVGATLPALIVAGVLQLLLGQTFNRGAGTVPA